MLVATRMTPSGFHIPPRPAMAGAGFAGPARQDQVAFSAPRAKKPTERLSGAQKGYVAPSRTCASGYAVRLARTNRATSARRSRPHGPSPHRLIFPQPWRERERHVVVGGGVARGGRIVSGGSGGGVWRRSRSAGPVSAAAARRATAALMVPALRDLRQRRHPNRPRRLRPRHAAHRRPRVVCAVARRPADHLCGLGRRRRCLALVAAVVGRERKRHVVPRWAA